MLEVNVAFLTESEREVILEVLKRDEELRRAEELRVRRLKLEVLDMKRKGAKRGSGRYSERSCGRCQESLGRVLGGASQCRVCKHHVCRNCRLVQPNGAWVCTVCSKEVDLKKCSGDWFYDQRVNRFSTAPGHDIVRASLKKRPPLKKRETAGDLLLNSTELKPSPAASAVPVPRPRKKDHAPSNKGQLSNVLELPEAREPQRSVTESAEKSSLCSSRTSTESSHSTPALPRKGIKSPQHSPAGSTVSSLTQHSPAGSTVSSLAGPSKSSKPPSPIPEPETASLRYRLNQPSEVADPEVDRLFKKSVRRVHKISGSRPTSTLDLREDGVRTTDGSMGDRSKSVPGLNVTDDEEDEDIDNLVTIHRRNMGDSTSSLRSSPSTLGSMMSVYSEAGDYDCVEVTGDILFSISFQERSQTLSILVKECRGLAYADAVKQRCNPYVKCYLLPDKSRQGKKKTATKRNNINPIYNETLKYSISRSQVTTRTLQLSVWHYDRFGRNAFLGEVEVPLDCHDIDSGHQQCVALRGRVPSSLQHTPFSQYKGELVISLKYITAKNTLTDKSKAGKKGKGKGEAELHVLIKEARNLTAMKAGGTSDSFVKGYLLPSNSKSTKRKTPVAKKTLNPHYNHTFVYKDVSVEQLRTMCLELTVWDREALSSNDFLGGVRLSTGTVTLQSGKEEWLAESSPEEVSLWERVMQYPDSWAEGTLPLRASMGKSK
ncbi:synaptotagmin-like protein 4 isoform X1 [Alosa sapidissima]|uniref:synaptotagmin-like protein 4 isoform X1 n=1 Tax=Alosa sapidissima TaxID=34773 RepID=UPI001C0985D2|nr:synaptotagmin-like protein 4 isoform X1 [Alosa sapidissima]XP_041929878.1 synaptotagmin-like protein 4 isoform X1 [Alosa sapidissima]XP_041929879.1 synaptotagmin-like protein 4 isoform X1 [Alosa sapidissima]